MIDNVIEISKAAGDIIREGFGKQMKIGYKTGDNNLVTEIDLESKKVIIDSINANFLKNIIFEYRYFMSSDSLEDILLVAIIYKI